MIGVRMLGGVLMVAVSIGIVLLHGMRAGTGDAAIFRILAIAVPVGALTGGWYLAPHLRKSPAEAFSFGLGASFVGTIYFAILFGVVDTLNDLIFGRFYEVVEVFTRFFNSAVSIVVDNFFDPVLFGSLVAASGLAGIIGAMLARRSG